MNRKENHRQNHSDFLQRKSEIFIEKIIKKIMKKIIRKLPKLLPAGF